MPVPDKHHAADSTADRGRPTVAARLIEATPEMGGAGHWLLASPMLLFIGWLWTDLFRVVSPLPGFWPDLLLGGTLYLVLWVLPLGYAAHRVVTALPRLFHHAGWDLKPLEPVGPGAQFNVRYTFRERQRAQTDWPRIWMRAAQGWVYLEIAAIFVGAIAMVPIFFSVTQYGFGR